jgi:hypothetical protein
VVAEAAVGGFGMRVRRRRSSDGVGPFCEGDLGEGFEGAVRWIASMRSTSRVTVWPGLGPLEEPAVEAGLPAKGISNVELAGPDAANPAGITGDVVGGSGTSEAASGVGTVPFRGDSSLTMAGRAIRLDSVDGLVGPVEARGMGSS